MSDYWKKKLGEQNNNRTSSSYNTSSTSKSYNYWKSRLGDQEQERKKKKEEEEAKRLEAERLAESIARKSQEAKMAEGITKVLGNSIDGRTWFQKGLFEDGYDFGDITKTWAASNKDLSTDFLAGAVNKVENVIDASAGWISGAANTLGAKGVSNSINDFIKKDIIPEDDAAAFLNAGIGSKVANLIMHGKDYESMSIWGDKTDSLSKSAGGMAVTAGLQYLGVPWQATTAITVYGEELDNALNNGASTGEAHFSAAVSAGAEVLTGSLFKIPGISSTGSGKVGQGIVGKLTKNISSTAVKNLINYGVNIFGEGFEEVGTSFFQRLGQVLSYEREDTLKELAENEEARSSYVSQVIDKLFGKEAQEEYGEAFTGGMVMAGFGGAPATVEATRAGRDINTGLNTDEQTVLDKAVEEVIKQEESKSGKKLTTRQKIAIEKKVQSYLDDGRISTDFIESIIGGDSYAELKGAKDAFEGTDDYKAYEKLLNEQRSLPALEEELAELGKQPNTVENNKKYDALSQRIEAIKNGTELGELETKLSPEANRIVSMRDAVRKEVYSRVKDSRLAESYRELARSNQKLDMDASQYTNETARRVVQHIVDSQLMDNTNQSKRTVEFLAKLAADKGLDIEALSNEAISKARKVPKGTTIHGYISSDGKMTLNMESPRVLQTTAGHEITHVFEGTELYNELAKVAKDYCITKEGLDKYNARIKEAEDLYSGDENTTPEGEVVADLIGEYLFTDEEFINNLAANKNVFKRVYDEIKYLYKIAVAGSREQRQLEKVKRAFDRVYQQTVKFDSEADGKVQNSIRRDIVDVNGKEYDTVVELDKAVSKRVFSDIRRFKSYILNSLVGLEIPVLDENGNTEIIEFAKKGETTAKNGKSHTVLDELVSTKGDTRKQVIVNAEEVINESVYDPKYSSTDNEHGWLDENGWESRKTYVLAKDGQIYEAYLKIAKARDGRNILYAVNLDIKKGIAVDQGATQKRAAVLAAMPVDGTVAQNKPVVKEQKSISKDSTGKKLSLEQSEFFKDSKAIDELGNLVRVYHGTRKADFTVFKRNATYFTDNKDMADSYSPNGDMYEGYVNITKPYEIDAQGEKWSKIPIDEDTKEFLERYGSSVFEEDGEWRTSPADIVAAIEEAIEEGEVDYDGIIIRNVDDTGSYYKDKDSHLATDYITFNSNQFKNVDNTSPTSDPDIRFSMSKEEKAKVDKDYMDAVARKDEDTLKHLVREYAKASMPETKLLDEDGNPRMVYHGTNTGDFTVFDPDYIGASSGDSGFFGMGFYFAYSKGEASYYGASRVIPAYLDLKNPFNFDKELRTYNGKTAMSGHAPDAVALMNFADKFPDIAMSITLDVAKEYGKVESISLFEFSKEFKNVIENKYFEVEETVNDYGEKETIVTADPQTHSYEYNGETVTYRDFGFQKRWYGTPNEYDVAYEYLANSVYSYIDMPRLTSIILDNNREFTAKLKEMGYDGTIQSEYGDEAVAFDPSQIKSAEPITYDDNGDVIPLSKRFDRSQDDIRFSMSRYDEQVNAYQYNIGNGDTDMAEWNIEELANITMPDSKIRGEDGRLIPLYHGTKEMFYEFDPTIGGGKNGTAEGFGIYLSDNQEVTNAYGNRQIKLFANITKPATSFEKTISRNTLVKLIKDTCEKQAQQMVEEEGYDSIEDAIRDTWVSNYVMTYDMSMDQAYREVATSMLQENDNDKDIIHEVMFGMAIRDYPAAMKFYRESLTPVTGIDGFITKWTNSNTGESSNIYLAFDSSQLKSAEAVTYDNAGNAIPVTERFDPNKKDFRYSISKDGDEEIPFGYKSAKELAYNKENTLDDLADLLPIRDDINTTAPTNNVGESDTWRESFEAITDDDAPPIVDNSPVKEISTVAERLQQKIDNTQAELDKNRELRIQSAQYYDEEIARLQEKYDSKRNKNSKVAQSLLRSIERLKRLKGNIDADYSKRISDLEARVEKMNSPEYRTAEQRRAKMQEHTDFWGAILGDTSTWKDLALGLAYKTKTLRRILRKVVKDANGKPDIAKADAIYDALETRYDHHEAQLKKESVKLKEVFKNLKLNHAEDTYAHMLGEFRHNPQTTLTEDAVKEFYEKNKGKIDNAKVERAIAEARDTFDKLLVRVNEVLREQGMKEIPYRKGYFPHFTNPKQGWLAKLLNWKTVDNEIPTSIAGLTEQFDPQRSWQGFNKERKGDTTDYSLYQGLDTYIHGALDWIYHIDDLQSRRALENHIRYIHSEEGVKARIDEIKANEYLDADATQTAIEAVLAEASNPLNNLVTELRARTNTLANKKASMDRGMEEATNRKIYSTMTNLNNRINANMVVGSFSSALTNFIPMVQSWHQVSPYFTVRGLGDFIRSTVRDDGMVAKSDFLTNRLIEEEKLYQTGWDKVSDKAAFMMNVIDGITSQTVWRSKYLQNMKEGMSESEAIKDADQFAKNLIAGRSRGNMPTIFDAKNPLIKVATAFQLEVANQYGFMFEDTPQDTKSKARLVKGYATAFMGAYLYNALYSSLVGRDAAFDPISIIEDLLGDLFGDDEEEPEDIVLNLVDNILDEVPFVSGLTGGGRIPISSALPYEGDYESFVSDAFNGEIKAKEMLKPLYYLAMPVGGGQIKKTVEGLSMFDDGLPVTGSYTDSGALRFPVEDTIGNRIQAGMFGQYASKNAREYFDKGYAPLGEKQIQEFIDVDIPIRDYWEYREGLKGLDKAQEKVDYIYGLDLPIGKKNILVNNQLNRKEKVNLTDYGKYDNLEEFDFAKENPEKYDFFKSIGVTYQDYANADEKGKDAYNWAFDNPEKYTVSKAVTGDLFEYKRYTSELNDIRADKDSKGKTISGSAKEKKIAYINGLDIDYGARLILFKDAYPADDTYNMQIIEYLNGRDDFSYEDRVTILKELGFTVKDGKVYWD